jgi:hypothetical protein
MVTRSITRLTELAIRYYTIPHYTTHSHWTGSPVPCRSSRWRLSLANRMFTTTWYQNLWRIRSAKKSVDRAKGCSQMSWMEKLNQARARISEQGSDPWRGVIERGLPANVTSISTTALLDLLDVPHSTGNARKLATTMRSMGFIPLKSRGLMPGGFRDTTIRGWARPVREKRPTQTITSGHDRGAIV